jgi:hypothetical protein
VTAAEWIRVRRNRTFVFPESGLSGDEGACCCDPDASHPSLLPIPRRPGPSGFSSVLVVRF